MVDLVPEGTELLGGLELGGVPIATVLSARTGLPALFVRKKAKEYGTCKLAEGPDVAGRRVTLVEDVITTGGAVRDATRALREAGAVVEVVVCAIDRSPEGENPLADVGLEVRPVLTKAELDAARGRRRPGSSRPRRGFRRPSSGVPRLGGGAGRGGACATRRRPGSTEKARITMIALSMFSPSAGNACAEEVAEQRDADAPTATAPTALQRKNRRRSIRVTPATTVM